MEDAISRSSLDSSSTGDEYVLVNADPKLRITGDINDINSEICDETQSVKSRQSKMSDSSLVDKEIGSVIPSSQSVDILNTNGSANAGVYCFLLHPIRLASQTEHVLNRTFSHDLKASLGHTEICFIIKILTVYLWQAVYMAPGSLYHLNMYS